MCHLFWWDSLIISPTELQYIVLTLIGKVFCRKTFEINLFRYSIQEAFLHYEPSPHSQCVYILVMLDGMDTVMPLIHEIRNPHGVYSFSNLNKLFCLTVTESRTGPKHIGGPGRLIILRLLNHLFIILIVQHFPIYSDALLALLTG